MANERLRAVLLSSFTDAELRRLWELHDPASAPELPGVGASAGDIADKILALVRHRGDAQGLLAWMRRERPGRANEIDALAADVAASGTMSVRVPRWFPARRVGSDRFVGRAHELERLHAMLLGSRVVGITAQIRGLGGVGKSLLAVEYALHYGEAWPGGVFWIEADPAWASAPATPNERMSWRHGMLAGLAASLDVAVIPGDLVGTARAVERAIAAHTAGERHLWIIDDLPPGVDQPTVEVLLPASPLAALLITTRWMALDALPNRLDLGVLDATAAYTLLTTRRPPGGEAESVTAHALAVDVGRHPLALDVLGALVRDELSPNPYGHWRARLAAPGDDFDRAGEALHDQLPTGSARAITRVLAISLKSLKSVLSLDILRVAAALGDAAIPIDLLREVLENLGRLGDERGVLDDLRRAVAELAAHALIRRAPSGGLDVHAIVRWVARRWPVAGPVNASIDEVACEQVSERYRSSGDLARHPELLALQPHAAVRRVCIP